MKIEVNGITFSHNDLVTLSISRLELGTVSYAHLFLMVGSRYFMVLRAGDYIDQEFLHKYQERGVNSFYAYEVADQACIKTYNEHWKSLKNAKTEQERIAYKDQIFLSLYSDFWADSSQQAVLSLVISCYESFENIDSSVLNEIQSTSHILYSRALLGATQGIVAALANGFFDYDFLRDLYNVCFLLDYGLVTNNFSYPLLQACEFERNNPSAGKKAIEKILMNPGDRDFFFDHPHISAQMAESLEDSFKYPELINAIKMHHEKVDGTGFPEGIHYSAISSWEAILQFADFTTPFEETIFSRSDGNRVLKEPILKLNDDEKFGQLPVKKITQMVITHFKWAITYDQGEAS
jgi:hypothetical protein